jgi:hypothetical protein
MTFVSGFAASPYLVALTEHFIRGSPDWFPYLVIILVGGVFYAVGVDVLRIAAAGIVIGVVLFALGQQYYPQRIDWLHAEAPKPF